MSFKSQSPLLWLDLEFTDLDVKRGQIVEIASIITDANLNVKATGPSLVIHQPDEVLENMIQWNKVNFAQTGLLEEIKSSTVSLNSAYQQTLKFIKKHSSFQTAMLAGASVYIDREYLGEYMPEIYNYLHHHIVDTNTLKELMVRWYPKVPPYTKKYAHRALDDILESINELKYYRESIFK